ncbi:glycosyltransferase family 4 protein [Loktanella salsilacus]|uniref:glycosyltransferase family 4 protein n=1 Tax=Loktanella salsilacus TaxID=195913 RepID=UPI003736DAFC
MTHRPTVLHLVDDTTAGGVMRVVDFLVTSGRLQAQAHHVTQQVSRGSIRPVPLKADIIVSHLTLNWRGLPGLIALRAANLRKPMIHVEHSYTAGFMTHNVARPRRFLAMLRLGFAMFDTVVAVSAAQAAWMRAQSLCRAGKIRTIASCVDLRAFRAIPRRAGPVRIFGAIGRLDRQKGFDSLIAAFRTLPQPDVALHIYGQGEEEAALRQLASGDPRIHFKGFAATPTDAFDAVDAVIMPSRWEAYGLVAIEALSAGRALICANIDGLNDHAAHGAIVTPLTAEGDIAGALVQAAAGDTGGAAALRTAPVLEEAFIQSWLDLIASRIAPRTQAA